MLCELCGEEQETSDHLLIHCKWSRKLWSIILCWWGISWVFPESSRSLLESWAVEDISKSRRRFWKILSYAVLWSIWEERNKRCFEKKKRTIEEVGELVKVRIAWWAKFRNAKCPYSISTIQRCIEEVRENS
ncbi:hypothetical protein QQ045_025201 [Rhodiola kirilowii]